MDGILLFLLAFLISFIGSLQPGPVNLAVLFAASKHKYKQALYLAVGGSIPEVFYCYVALLFSSSLHGFIEYFSYIKIVFSIGCIITGFYLLYAKQKQLNFSRSSQFGFFLGLLLAGVNPQLILFWTFIFIWLTQHQIPLYSYSIFTQTMFAIGAAFGAFGVHVSLLLLIKKYSHTNINKFLTAYTNKIIGVVLLMLGLLEAGGMIW